MGEGLNCFATGIWIIGLRATAGSSEMSAFGEQESIGCIKMPESEARVSKWVELVKLSGS